MTDRLLKPSEARESYHLTDYTLKSLEKAGKLSPVRTMGNQRRYRESDLQALLSQPVEKFTQQQPQEFAIKPTNKDTYREFGSTGLQRWGGSIAEEKLRELQGLSGRLIFRQMRVDDSIVAAVFFACIQSLRQAAVAKRVEPASDKEADKALAEFVESCFDDMNLSWEEIFDFIANAVLEQGVALNELVYKKRLGENPPKYTDNPAPSKYNDGKVGWRKWAMRPVESLQPGNEWIFDENGGIRGIQQAPDPNTGKILDPIPIEKLLHFRTTVYPANTPEPPPIHRAAYLPWYYSQNYQEIEGIITERDAGFPVVYLGTGRSMTGTDSDYEKSVDLVTNIRVDEQMGAVFPGPKLGTTDDNSMGFLFEFVASPNTRANDISEKIERLDKRKAMVVLAGFILLGLQGVGSYALSRHQGDLFSLAVTAWLDSIAGVINRHAIPRLVKMNSFPGITGMPKLVFSPVGVPDLKTIAEYIDKLVGKSVLQVDDNLEAYLRQIADMPKMPQELEGKRMKDMERQEEMARLNPLMNPQAQTNPFEVEGEPEEEE